MGASMGASTVFFFMRVNSFNEKYKSALCFTGLVTLIATYHYFRIFNSFEAAFTPCKVTAGKVDLTQCNAEVYGYTATGIPFNDAYRYVDWLLTVPLLLIEIVLVMKLESEAETVSKCTQLGVSSALMIAFGYPGESSGDASTRWLFWSISMCPFLFIVYQLFVGLKAAQKGGGLHQEPGPVGLLGHRHLLVHLPRCLHPAHAHGHRGQGGSLCRGRCCCPDWLHCLRCHLQVRCRLPRVPHWSGQVLQHGVWRGPAAQERRVSSATITLDFEDTVTMLK